MYRLQKRHGQLLTGYWSYGSLINLTKRDVFQAVANTTVWTHHIDANKMQREKATQECYKVFWTNPGSNTPWNNSCTATYLPSLKQSKWNEQDGWRSKDELISNVLRTPTDGHVGWPARIYFSSVRTQDVVWKWWIIGTDGEKESGKSMLLLLLLAFLIYFFY